MKISAPIFSKGLSSLPPGASLPSWVLPLLNIIESETPSSWSPPVRLLVLLFFSLFISCTSHFFPAPTEIGRKASRSSFFLFLPFYFTLPFPPLVEGSRKWIREQSGPHLLFGADLVCRNRNSPPSDSMSYEVPPPARGTLAFFVSSPPTARSFPQRKRILIAVVASSPCYFPSPSLTPSAQTRFPLHLFKIPMSRCFLHAHFLFFSRSEVLLNGFGTERAFGEPAPFPKVSCLP